MAPFREFVLRDRDRHPPFLPLYLPFFCRATVMIPPRPVSTPS